MNVPLTREETNLAENFMQVHRQNANVREVIKINPLNLVTHQPVVNLDQSGKYRQDAITAARYAKHSIAIAQGAHNMQMQAGLNTMDITVPHGEFAFVFNQQVGQFQVLELARHISVTKFQDRMLLWAGYHRSYAFIENANPEGIERSLLVALTTDADFLVSPHSPNQGLRAVITGLRPPLFRDFIANRKVREQLRRAVFGRGKALGRAVFGPTSASTSAGNRPCPGAKLPNPIFQSLKHRPREGQNVTGHTPGSIQYIL